MKRSRGRPRQFDEELVLEAAGRLFWTRGLSATSLDDLAAAMGMNRPSIYRAFGDKETLYRKTLERYCLQVSRTMTETLFQEQDVRQALRRFYTQALEVYTVGEQPLGCMVVSTAVGAATCHPEVRADLLSIVHEIDDQLAARMTEAVEAGQLPADFDIRARAGIAQSVLHSLSIRARAGESSSRLRSFIDRSVEVILSGSP